MSKMPKKQKWKIAVDRGGTFTDVVGIDPTGAFHTEKLLSLSPAYEDASIEGIRRMLGIEGNAPLPEERIEMIRFGTTVATNALLERKGGKVALFITEGLADLLEIGYQARPDIFSLAVEKPRPLYTKIIEVKERLDSNGKVVLPLDETYLKRSLDALEKKNFDAVAVVLMHAWKNPAHELTCEEIIRKKGVKDVFLSHRTMNLVKIVSRGQSAVVDAYLSPIIHSYLDRIKGATGNIPIEFMMSSGGLARPEHFLGKDAILSGPAGGVIAIAGVAEEKNLKGAIGFDMGGTSTDVSRYDGRLEKVYEKTVEGIELQKEMLAINAVAAGGGSILAFDGQRMLVGPESAGADPGPTCYGFGGPLTVTDANLLTGRIDPAFFPSNFGPKRNAPLDEAASRKAFEKLTRRINEATGSRFSTEETAAGFLRVADERMALAIKEISVSKGYDVRDYALVCFGGAGGQHACRVASLLGIKKILFHPLASLMSAYGIGLARGERKEVQSILVPFSPENCAEIEKRFGNMESKLLPGGKSAGTAIIREIDLRPSGADDAVTLPFGDFEETFSDFFSNYERRFGFAPARDKIEAANLRVEMREAADFFSPFREARSGRANEMPPPLGFTDVLFDGRVISTPRFGRESLPVEVAIPGPALVTDRYSTLVIDPGFEGRVETDGVITINLVAEKEKKREVSLSKPDPVLLEVFNNLFMNVAVEMGLTLKNTAHSVNIKERLDFSCALFDVGGNLVANAPHIPVHLGAMADSVKGVVEMKGDAMQPGDLYLTNNPYRGGSHLPDMTVVCPVFSDDGDILFFVAARGHHSDIGGTTPGSMPPTSKHIDEEGVLFDGMLIARKGRFLEEEVTAALSTHRYPARNIAERLSDLRAEAAACRKGEEEIERVISRYGQKTVAAYMNFVRQNAEFLTRKALSRFLSREDAFRSSFEDSLDDGTLIRVAVNIEPGKSPPQTVSATINFTGTGPEHREDNLNAPVSVTRAAVLYVLRCITGADIPLNSGCLAPVEIVIPEETILSPSYPSPVASGNVETSQRVVDVLLGALGVAAASQGTMNNLLFQVEGDAPYYETIAGGSGATEGHAGASGVQVHMTNTRMTDPEVLEFRHPHVRLERFDLRKGSGGEGQFRGGDGVVRQIKFLKPAEVSLISERRATAPYGMEGGEAGKSGKNSILRKNGQTEEMGHRFDIRLKAGDAIVVETPGGGGWGKKKDQ